MGLATIQRLYAYSILAIAMIMLVIIPVFAIPSLMFALMMAHIYSDKRLMDHWEIIDLPSVPLWFKNYLQDIMMFKWTLVFSTQTPVGGLGEALTAMSSLIERTGHNRLVALACGAGGLECFMHEKLNNRGRDPPLKLLLTDLHPNVKPGELPPPHVTFHPKPVDALNLPPEIASAQIVSITGSLHHFNQDQVRSFLESAVRCGSSMFLLDGACSLKSVLLMPLRSFALGIAAGTWYGVARGDLRQLGLTMTGILPVCMSHDALISALRFYSRSEIEEIIQTVSGHENYEWDLSRWGSLPECSIMIAYPKK